MQICLFIDPNDLKQEEINSYYVVFIWFIWQWKNKIEMWIRKIMCTQMSFAVFV